MRLYRVRRCNAVVVRFAFQVSDALLLPLQIPVNTSLTAIDDRKTIDSRILIENILVLGYLIITMFLYKKIL